MKKITTTLLILLCSLHIIIAQVCERDTTDPMIGNYVLGNNAEIVFQYANTAGQTSRRVFDFGTTGFSSTITGDTIKTNLMSTNSNTAVITGDFDGDNADEIISAWVCRDSTLFLSISKFNKETGKWTNKNSVVTDSAKDDKIRLIAGNFDDVSNSEFILSYIGIDDKLHICLFQTDSSLNPEKKTEIKYDNLKKTKHVYSNGWTETTSYIYVYDIAKGDFDADGIDEIFILIPYDVIHNDDINYSIKSKTAFLDYKHETNSFVLTSDKDFLWSFNSHADNISTFYDQISGIAICTGKYNSDRKDEIACIYELNNIENGAVVVPTGKVQTLKSYMLSYFNTYYFDSISQVQTIEVLFESFKEGNSLSMLHSLSICSGDINNDGTDEVITSTANYTNLYKVENNNFSVINTKQIYSNTPYNFNSPKIVALSNIDPITLQKKLSSEMILVDFGGSTTARLCVYRINIDEAKNISISNSPTYTYNLGLSSSKIASCSIALGDFDGDGLRIGKPTKICEQNVFVPSLVMNTPPSHYDILDTTYNVSLHWPKPSSFFQSSYLKLADETAISEIFSTQALHYWICSNSVNDSLKSAIQNIMINKNIVGLTNDNNKVAASITQSATIDDRVFGVINDFFIYQYPIYYEGKQNGTLFVSVPIFKKYVSNLWKNVKDLDFNSFQIKHEIGNLLSYPANIDEVSSNISNQKIFVLPKKKITYNPIEPSTFEYSQILDSIKNDTNSIIFPHEKSFNGPVWKGIKGEYEFDQVQTHKAIIGKNFSLSLYNNILDEKIEGDISYDLTPYMYWSESGAFTVDYTVDLTGAWWTEKYGHNPDPAFILPFRYDQEKGLSLLNKSQRTQTSDIRYFPYDALPGDTITIMATVRNFCLNNTVDNVKVNFYLGDPADGGEFIKSMNYGPINPRGYISQTFKYKTPDNPAHPFIFGVIDPGNTIKEIHKDNNKAWMPLFGTSEYPNIVSAIVKEYSTSTDNLSLSNYPNPASKETTLHFYIESVKVTNLSIYNCLGQLVDQRKIDCDAPGWQYFHLNLSRYAPGIYLYRVTSGKYNATKKMIVE
jgi:hypothetical protein